MRKIIIFAIVLFSFVGCYDYYEGATLQTVQLRVESHEWTDAGDYFYAEFPMPEITEHVFDYGEVKAYLVSNRMDYATAQKNLLPYVLHQADGEFLYSQTIDFEYGIKWARVYYTISDFVYEGNPPAMEFDVVITIPQDAIKK